MQRCKENDLVTYTLGMENILGKPCYPWVLVNREIVSPGELCEMSDDDLRMRWGHYINANRDGVFERMWSCRSYAREAVNPNTRSSVLIPAPYPTRMATLFEPLILLFWPPRMVGDAIQYIAHWGSSIAAIDGLRWLLDQPLPTYNGPRANLYIFSTNNVM